jgi:hypothetical protein
MPPRESGVATPSNVHQPATAGQSARRGGKIGNSSHPGPSDDRGKPLPHEKKVKTSASGREIRSAMMLPRALIKD